MATQDRGIRTRQTILEAAAAVFEEYGYEAAKVSDILARAQVTKGALYFHFASKEELALAILDAQVPEGPLELPRSPALQTVVDLGMVFAHRLSHDRLLRGSVRLAFDEAGPRLARSGPYANWVQMHTDLFHRAKLRGELLQHVDPVESAQLIVGAYAGINMMARAMDAREDLDRHAAVLYRHVMPSIAVSAVLGMLDMAPGRGQRALAEAARAAAEPESGAAAVG